MADSFSCCFSRQPDTPVLVFEANFQQREGDPETETAAEYQAATSLKRPQSPDFSDVLVFPSRQARTIPSIRRPNQPDRFVREDLGKTASSVKQCLPFVSCVYNQIGGHCQGMSRP